MHILLTPEEARTLGALMEKEVSTPDHYPLSLNALTNACNQTTSRDPVVHYDETTVLRALDSLREKKLLWEVDQAGGRVRKYQQQFTKWHDLDPEAHAVMTLLLLRGAQTPGELKSRSDRLCEFRDLGEVEAVLSRLAERNPPFALRLPRLPGTKESRYMHLLCGEIDVAALSSDGEVAALGLSGLSLSDRVARLESELVRLRGELTAFRKEFE
ncbi:MAG: YceH family protein [Betaproteobacteria bacterium]